MFGDRFPAILSSAQQDDQWAWSLLYRDVAPLVHGYLRARGAIDPDELTGEVFLQVARGLDGFEGDERAFRAWLFTIARHRLIDDRRRRRRRPLQLVDDDTLVGLGETGDAEEEAASTLAFRELMSLVGRLTEEQQDVLLLVQVAGMTAPEAARVVGKTVGAVEALHRRGLAALRRHFESTRTDFAPFDG